ncbi:MAG: nitrogenase component 1 [Smithella sp.]
MQTNSVKLPTIKKVAPSFVSTRNACKLCAPLGASLVFRGIEGCVPLIHGSQGCATYIRRYVISHFKEPIDIASSNFSEATAIFGGADNLRIALDNLIRQYKPSVIGIASTCLSETIGDDVRGYLDQYKAANTGVDIPALVYASTPSYRGTHMDGYSEAVRATVVSLADGGPRRRRLNIIPGFLSAADLRHIKEILDDFQFSYTMLPDYSETLDGESWSDYQKLSPGGTPVSLIRSMGQSAATIQLGRDLTSMDTAASYLEENFGVTAVTLGIPIGIGETDRFFSVLEEIAGISMPKKHEKERGRLVDAYIDGHKYVAGRRAVVFGEADFVASMASFLDEIGIVPALCATGASTKKFKETVSSGLSARHNDIIIREDSDFEDMLEICRSIGVDIIIGNSKGYYLAKNLNVPLVRAGFPIHDRIGGQRILHVGYEGTQQLFDRIVNALIEHKQSSSVVGYSYI